MPDYYWWAFGVVPVALVVGYILGHWVSRARAEEIEAAAREFLAECAKTDVRICKGYPACSHAHPEWCRKQARVWKALGGRQ